MEVQLQVETAVHNNSVKPNNGGTSSNNNSGSVNNGGGSANNNSGNTGNGAVFPAMQEVAIQLHHQNQVHLLIIVEQVLRL